MPDSAVSTPSATAYDLADLQFLVVDDNPNMLRLLETMLRGLGISRIDCQGNAKKALKPGILDGVDIIICDWLLEPITCMEYVRRVRARNPERICFVPIIQLSGFTQQSHVEQSRDAGITEFLSLPVSPKLLYERIVYAIEQPRSFIDSSDYFGPDRRRRADENYAGEERRLHIPDAVEMTGEEGPRPKLEFAG